MFDNYVFTEGTCKNVEKENKIAGFQLQSLISYYRGIPCSMIHDIKDRWMEKRFQGKRFSLVQIKEKTFFHWMNWKQSHPINGSTENKVRFM